MRVRFEGRCVLMAALALGGCGNGQRFGPWLPYAGAGAGVFAVYPSAPSAGPITLDTSYDVRGLRVVERGAYSAATGAVSGKQLHSAIWISGGRILRADATGLSPSVVRVSSESTAGVNPTFNFFCDSFVIPDWAVPGDSRFFYVLAGPDGHCLGTDDVLKSTPVTSPANEAPRVVPGNFVSEIRSPSTGAITGWLLIDGTGGLVRTDPGFANPVQLLASAGLVSVVGHAPSHLFLFMRSGTQATVRRFDTAAGTLDTTALFTLPGATGFAVQDDSTVFMKVFDGRTANLSVWRLALAATQAGSAVQMTSESAHEVRGSFRLTANKVVFTTNAAGTDSLVAVDKTAAGTAPAPALGAARESGTFLGLVGTAGDKVYVNAFGSIRTALAVTEAGTDAVAQANATWVGLVDVAGAGTAILASGLSGTINFGGGSLSTVVANTGAQGLTLGRLPPEITDMYLTRSWGGRGLLSAFTDANSVYSDIFFVDAGAAGSLVRVTNTPSISESPP